ncbi:hypothetical protein GOBAR_AA13598 [Gossypium barbadense]|uniref:RNA helicase n=1 Tax=Gossypium barbadense TaxID=3634 RepID=A0A2P5XUN9_GOSBA|nr:hypothetical protein GOBAR_AA13598 [Gossypium barbadense]
MRTSWADSVANSASEIAVSDNSSVPRPTRSTYVPPHLRNRQASDAPNLPGPATERAAFTGTAGGSLGSRWSSGPPKPEMGRPGPGYGYAGAVAVAGRGGSGGGWNNRSRGWDRREREDIPVETSGENVPPPVNTFAEIDLGDLLNQNIRRCKYVRPTPIQRHAIPIALAGRDLMACAQTGSGKTAAFCFPIISGIMREQYVQRPRVARTVYPLALILSPTRELSCQVGSLDHVIYKTRPKSSHIKLVSKWWLPMEEHQLINSTVFLGLECESELFVFHKLSDGLRELERGVDILVATPGRLVDLLERARLSLQMIRYLALDEADRMLDMGFEPQIRKIVEQMDMPNRGVRQTMLFSATFPREIQVVYNCSIRLASDFLSNYIFLAVGRVGSSTDLIVQRVEFVHESDKRSHLMDLLHAQRENGAHGKQALTLVFVETKKGADSLEHWLCINGFPATTIHGDRTQQELCGKPELDKWSGLCIMAFKLWVSGERRDGRMAERELALRSFKTGKTPILVATDVAARGLDIPHVAHVINFDLPNDIDDYVHRIGRTGRAGKSGLATAFFNEGNLSLARPLAELMQEASQEVPAWLTRYASRAPYGGSKGRRSGGGRFGGRDFRRESSFGKNLDYYGGGGNSGSGYGVPSSNYGGGYAPGVASAWD